jgi:hypothetical protein
MVVGGIFISQKQAAGYFIMFLKWHHFCLHFSYEISIASFDYAESNQASTVNSNSHLIPSQLNCKIAYNEE